MLQITMSGNRPIASATITSGGRAIPARFLIDTGANASLLFAGPFAKTHELVFDYSRERMILEPYDHFAPATPRNLSGLMLTTGGRGHWHDISVSRIVPDSPAASAGFEEGDRIVSVDDRPIREFTQHTLGLYFGRDGKKVRVVVQRGSETKKLELALRRLL